jgi:uncharacterized membrane protein
MESRWAGGRTEAFSDGVFAIAVTLLVLDLHVPESDLNDLWHGIVHQWPNYLAYATSFITIGGIWLAHHAIFRRLRYVNTQVMRLNLLLLMTVSFLPFPTGLAAQAIRDTNAERVAVIFYGTSLLLVSVVLAALWRTAARDPKLLRPEVTEQEIRAITNRATPNIGLYVGATVLAVFHPNAAAGFYLAIALVTVARARGDTPAHEPEASQAA